MTPEPGHAEKPPLGQRLLDNPFLLLGLGLLVMVVFYKLQLPESSKADISATCVNGGIKTERLALESSNESSRRRVEGRLNGGGPRVRLETVNGGVRIVGKS